MARPPQAAATAAAAGPRPTHSQLSTLSSYYLLIACCLLLAATAARAQPVSYGQRTAAGLTLHVITVDLNDPHVVVSPVLAQRGIGRAESFVSFISRLHPTAAINGTFFSKRSLRPIGDIVAGGKLLHFGGMGTALAFARDGVDLVRLPNSRRVDWSGYRAAVAAGPLLVWDGFAKPHPGGEGFADPHVFARAAPRSAAGVTADNKLLLVTTLAGASLARLAAALRELGAVYAVNLDGGSSCAMWYRGHVVKSPGRPLTNLLCVYVRPHAARRPLFRAPRGLDWRAGNLRRPLLSVRAAGVRISARFLLGKGAVRTLRVASDRPLAGAEVRLRLDGALVGTAAKLPVDFTLTSHPTRTGEHKLWLGVLDARGRLLNSAGVMTAD